MAIFYSIAGLLVSVGFFSLNVLVAGENLLGCWAFLHPVFSWGLMGLILGTCLHFAVMESHRLNRPATKPLLLALVFSLVVITPLIGPVTRKFAPTWLHSPSWLQTARVDTSPIPPTDSRPTPPIRPVNDIDYLKKLQARVRSVGLFEDGSGSPTPHGKRVYKTKFAKTDTRYIFWELNLEHPLRRNQRFNFPLKAILYNSSGNILKVQTHNTYVEPGWTWSYHSIGIGWNDFGKWLPGTYKIELYVGNKKVSGKKFEVFDPQTAKDSKRGTSPTPVKGPNKGTKLIPGTNMPYTHFI